MPTSARWLLPLLLFAPGVALGYPSFVAKGYTNCATCHYAPTGGGLPNAYGYAVTEATFPDDVPLAAVEKARDWLAKPNVLGFDDEGRWKLQADAGLDLRLLLTAAPHEVRGPPEPLLIPMLAEAAGVVAYGPLLLYASLTPRATALSHPATAGGDHGRTADRSYEAFSREHWLQYRIDESWSVRAGRIVLPFGIRTPDHTAYTRRQLGFNKWDQSYAVEANHTSEAWMLSGAAFAGDLLLEPAERQKRGVVFSAARNLTGRGAFGGSLLLGRSTLANEVQAALFARARLVQRSYVLAELAGYARAARKTDASQQGAAATLRVGWFALESLDLFLESGASAVAGHWNLTRLRYLAGANWQVLPWVELAPAVMLEEDVEAGPRVSWMAQVHLVY